MATFGGAEKQPEWRAKRNFNGAFRKNDSRCRRHPNRVPVSPRCSLRTFVSSAARAASMAQPQRWRRSRPAGPAPPALRSSLRCWRKGRWQLMCHQGTRLASGLGGVIDGDLSPVTLNTTVTGVPGGIPSGILLTHRRLAEGRPKAYHFLAACHMTGESLISLGASLR